ncbi:MAG: hypothetical protein KDA88_02410 [Planctomycetaceae bacterium]|nr:hypothetical protein [Planctomycetaceae bacterium]MCB9952914.1 hypothetical protein [Planctomycetaceae bacterium]
MNESPQQPELPPLTNTPQDWHQQARTTSGKQKARMRRLKLGLLATLLCCVIALVIYISCFRTGALPPVQFIGIGLTRYEYLDPHPCGETDVAMLAEMFQQWHEFSPGRIRAVEPTDVSKESTALIPEIEKRLRSAAQNGDRVVLYLSAHGYVRGDSGLGLLTIRTTREDLIAGRSDPVVKIADLVSVIKTSRVRDVLLLLDVGGVLPDPVTGVLACDESSLLLAELDEASKELNSARLSEELNLTIVCSHNPGQVNWPMSGDKTGTVNSVFGRTVRDAFTGEADGCRDSRAADGRITTEELWMYIKDKVEDWSRTHRGVSQTVTVYHHDRADRVQWLAVQSGEFAAAVEQLDQDESASENSVAESDQPAEPDKQDSPAVAEEPREKPTPESPQTLEDAWKELQRLNEQHLVRFPNRCRMLGELLASAEVAHTYGLKDSELLYLKRYSDHKKPLATWKSIWEADDRLQGISFTFGDHRSGADSATVREFEDLFKTLAQPTVTSEEKVSFTLALPPALEGELAKREFGYWLLRDTALNVNTKRLTDVKNVLQQLDRRGYRRSDWPYELLALNEYAERLQGQDPTEAWRKLIQLHVAMADLRPAFQQLEGVHDSTIPLEHLQKSVRALTAAQRWLMHSSVHEELARNWLQIAQEELDAFRRDCGTLARSQQLLDRVLVNFPAEAKWVSWLGEEGEQVRDSLTQSAVQQLADTVIKKSQEGRFTPDDRDVYQSWINPSDSDQSKLELALLEVWWLTRSLQSEISQSELNVDRLNKCVDELDRAHRLFEDQLRGSFFRFESGPVGAMDWVLLERTASLPWIAWDQRVRIRDSLAARETSGQIEPTQQIYGLEQGLWLGFWGLMSLELTETLEAEQSRVLWDRWKLLAEQYVAENNSTDLVRKRVKFGNQLAKAWSESREEHQRMVQAGQWVPFRPFWSAEDLMISATNPDDRFAMTELDVRQFCECLVPWWLDRQSISDQYDSLERSIERVGCNQRLRINGPTLGELEDVELDRDRHGLLRYRLDNSVAAPRELQLRVDAPETSLADTSPPGNTRPIVAVDAADQLTLVVQDELSEPRGCLVSLIDETGFPYDIRQVNLVPRIDSSEMSVQFRVVESGKFAFRTLLETKPQKFLLQMAPSHQFSLQPVLTIPSINKPVSARVGVKYFNEVLRLNELFSEVMVDLVPGKTEYALSFGEEGKKYSEVNVINGLEFTISIRDGEQQLPETKVTYFPRFRPPDQFLSLDGQNLRVFVDDLRFTAEGKEPPAKNETDLPLPAEIPVRLSDDGRARLIGKKNQPGDSITIRTGEDVTLSLKLDPQGVQEFEAAVDVAGWPHAARWGFNDGQIHLIPFRPEAVTRIRQLQAQQMFWRSKESPLEPIPIRLELNSEKLDNELNPLSPTLAGLRLEVRPIDRSGDKPRLIEEFHPRHSYQRNANLTLADDRTWNWATSVQDVETLLSFDNLSAGHYQLISTFSYNGQVEGQDHVDFYLDDSLPLVTLSLPATPLYGGETVKVDAKAIDTETGIQELLVWLDLDKSESPSKTEEQKSWKLPASAAVVEQLKQRELSAEFKVPREPGTYLFMASALNGAGQLGTGFRRFDVLPRKTSADGKPIDPAMAENGKVKVEFASSVWRGNVTLSGVDPDTKSVQSTKSKAGKTTPEIVFEDLKPGRYVVTAVRGGGGTVSKNVTVTGGQEALIKFDD